MFNALFKKSIIICFISLSITSFFAHAEDGTNNEKENYLSNDVFCFNAGKISSKFMEMRQNGNSIIRTLQFANILSSGKEDSYLVFKHFVIKAYEQPVQDNKINAQKSIREFSNKIILECIKEVEEDKEIKLYEKDNIPEDWLSKINNEDNKEE